MSAPLSLSGYRDCFEVLERALDSSLGVRVQVQDNNAAIHFRMRLNMARQLDRSRAKSMEGEDAWSEFDTLVFTIEDDDKGWWVRIQRRPTPMVIEEIAAE